MTGREPVRDVEIRDTSIRLGQFLKLAGLAEHGAHAKEMLEAGEVTVGGRPETRRGRRLGDGDVVAVAGTRVRCRAPVGGAEADRPRENRTRGRRPGEPGGTTASPGSW